MHATLGQILGDDVAPPRRARPRDPPGLRRGDPRGAAARPTARTSSARALGSALIPYASATGRAVWSKVFPPTAPPVVDDDDPQPIARLRARGSRRGFGWLLHVAAAAVAATVAAARPL
ncbi:MAG: hypothetical protein U0325_29485 [Polyangiales bacterium]